LLQNPTLFSYKKRTCGEDREAGRSVDNGGDQEEKNKAVKVEKEKEGKVETLHSKCYPRLVVPKKGENQ
jgi:hypothetical protein